MKKLNEQIKNCLACPLCEDEGLVVPGEGGFEKKVMIIGEAPGLNESKTGKPFVGRAGKLLDNVFEETGFKRDDFFITNIVKHRPPSNRNPEAEEMQTCFPFIEKQVNLLQPKVIVTLGKVSSQFILQDNQTSLRKLRGKVYKIEVGNQWYEMLVSVHPAAALYDWRWEQYLEKDFKLLRRLL